MWVHRSLLTKAIGERGLFYTDAAAWTFAAVFLAASYYIQLLIIRKKGLTYQNTVTKRGCKRCLQLFNLQKSLFFYEFDTNAAARIQ